MRNSPKPLKIHAFGPDDPLHSLRQTTQVQYLSRYLAQLGAVSVLEEPNYFDKDFLAEFSAFYGVSSRGYPNICRRLHFFSGSGITRSQLRNAAGGSESVRRKLQDNYLGFIVVRPIPSAPLGRTVVAWYPDKEPLTPRVVSPSREYRVHVAGVRLFVRGLAWQQQDTGVGACATVSLWTMLHASAFDDHHAMPSTADITRAAHKKVSLGGRVFPSAGLTVEQICEAIKEHGLSPIVFNGDRPGGLAGFSSERFASSCAASIRSGYPVLIVGELENNGLHAVCATGFRSCAPIANVAGEGVSLQDSGVQYLYIHDDNLGPNVRFRIKDNGPNTPAVIAPSTPPVGANAQPTNFTNDYPSLTPHLMIVAAHNDLRTSPDALHRAGIESASWLQAVVNHVRTGVGQQPLKLTVSARYVKLSDYLATGLDQTLGDSRRILGNVRLALTEKVPPMSLHLGLVRVGIDDSTPLADILFDTTDSDRNHPVFAHVCYDSALPQFFSLMEKNNFGNYGTCVAAF